MAALRGREVAAAARLVSQSGLDSESALASNSGPLLSVVVPIRNEAGNLETFLNTTLSRLPADAELILVDGFSDDKSAEIADGFNLEFLQCEKGRAVQMNFGAAQAEGLYLLFLHADTLLPESFAEDFSAWLQSRPVWGFSPVRLSGSSLWCRVIERSINLRVKITGGASGDQAQIVSAEHFQKLGGFAEIDLMEDIELSYRLRRRWPSRPFKSPVTTSSRRWQEGGVVRTVLLMWFLRSSYLLGVSPKRLASWYS